MQRYFANGIDENDNFILEDSDIHHIKNVMRYDIGTHIEVVYDNKVHLCTIESIDKLLLKIDEIQEEDRDIPVQLTIAIGLVTEQKFDLIIQKLTELGVNKIIPVKMERSIVKLEEEKIDKKLIRWNKICKEASEQSHRVTIPEVTKPMSLKELIEYNKSELKLICSLNDNPNHLSYYLKENIKDILFVIGPEGGITKEEELLLINNGFKTTTLGKRVLRVETAAMYVTGIVNYVYKG